MGFVKRRTCLLGCLVAILLISFSEYYFFRVTDWALGNTPRSNLSSSTIGYSPFSTETSSRSTLTPASPRYVITYEEYGQLGNNMFQYAGMMGVGLKNNKIPLAKPKTQLKNAFKLRHVMEAENYQDWTLVAESAFAKYDPKFEHLPDGNIYLQAYFQSYRYFQNYAKEVKEDFQFLDHIQSEARTMLDSFRKSLGNRKLIGVHVRRGDKLFFKDRSQGDMVASDSYFQKAFKWMREHHGNVSFLVASDDVDWCRGSFEKESDVNILPFASREVHLCLLSMCHHVIMSVGTFGWWAGWLSGGDVIYYKNQVREGSPRSTMFNISDFAPPSWIGFAD